MTEGGRQISEPVSELRPLFSVISPPSGIILSFRTNIPNYTFVPEPVSDGVMKILGTTNILNGSFLPIKNDRDDRSVSRKKNPDMSATPTPIDGSMQVFLATWKTGNRQKLAAVHHTPDICWSALGWKLINTLELPKLALNWDGIQLPFESRLFRAPDAARLELACWSTLIGGRVIPDLRASPAVSDIDGHPETKRQYGLPLRHLWLAVAERWPLSGTKQFVRLSVSASSDVQSAVRAIKAFGVSWLELRKMSDPE